MGGAKSKLKIDYLGSRTLNVNSLAWTPDSQQLGVGFASSTNAGAFILRDLKTGKSTTVLGGSGRTLSALSPDGQWLVVVAWPYVEIYKGTVFRNRLSDIRVTRVCWSPDSNQFAAASEGNVGIYDAASGRVVKTLKGEQFAYRDEFGDRQVGMRPLVALRWSPDSRWIASAGLDSNEVCLWDVAAGTLSKRMKGHPRDVLAVCWSPDSRYIASGAKDYSARIWDIYSGECVMVLVGHHGRVNAIDWSRNGRLVATGSADNTVRLWDAQSGNIAAELTWLANPGGFTHVVFSPNSADIAIADYSSVAVFEVPKKKGIS